MESTREDGFPVFYAPDLEAWRSYLATYGDQLTNTWLVLFKKDTGVASITYEEARDEALCFGWVDSKPNKRDDDSYYLFFARRNPKSNWSRVNKKRVAALRAAGRMAPAGEALVRIAKENGSWDALNDVENLVVPEDLARAFTPEGRKNWEAFPRSVKRGILEWIFNAKRPATREKRILETASKAAKNERANQFRK
ncbi:hypothetical protein E1J53_0019415 [Lewinella sp. W8]|nr:hypothetical protein [Lewinella sp. W8]